MSRKKKDYAKLYDKYMNTNSTFENDMFNCFRSMYDQKLQDPDFNPDVEKCKLTLRANNSGVDSSLGIYVSSYISVGTFIFGIVWGKYIAFSIGIGLLILATGIFATLTILQHTINVDVWNTSLIALDTACRDKHKIVK